MKNNEYADVTFETGTDTAVNSSKKKKLTVFIVLLCIALITAGVTLGLFLAKDKTSSVKSAEKTSASSSGALKISATPSSASSSSSSGVLTGTQIAAKVRPSVAGILVYGGTTLKGEGSCIFMSEDSTKTYTYVLTCAHILDISGATSFKVELEDGTQYDASVVGYDAKTDVGIVKIKATGFTLAEFGDSDKLSIGDTIYTIGNPGGLDYFGTMTQGIISGISVPSVSSDTGYTSELIQFDAAINSGSSGGALVNCYGQVVGITNSKIVATTYEGMAFAVPISVAKDVVNEILEKGSVTDRAKIGITYESVSYSAAYQQIVSDNDLPAGSVIITAISSDSDLYDSDVKTGDIIIAVNGKNLTKKTVLVDIMKKAKPGDVLQLTLARANDDGSVTKYEYKVTLVQDTSSASSSETETTTASSDFFDPFDN
jgi:serine protease Do